MTIQLSGVTSMAARHILEELGRLFETQTGIKIAFTAMGGVEAARRLREGLPVDLAALAAPALDKLAQEGHLVPGARLDYARSDVALAVPAGAPHPPIDTAEAVRAAMLKAKRFAYSTGPSGDHVKALWERWGITPEMAVRGLQAPPGVPVATLLAQGEADLGLQQLSELLGQPGIEILGPLPPDIELVTIFAAATGIHSQAPEAAARFLAFLTSDEAQQAVRRSGMQPIPQA